MKPGEHPDFFRFPAPPGRSRESSLRLDADGGFWHEGARVEHPGMQRAFASWIARHPDDGRYVLSNGYDWTYLRVDDVPFFVVGVEVTEDALVLALSDGSHEPLSGPVWLGANEALYVAVKEGRFTARFQPGVQAGLGPVLESSELGFALRSGDERIPIGAAPPEAAGAPD